MSPVIAHHEITPKSLARETADMAVRNSFPFGQHAFDPVLVSRSSIRRRVPGCGGIRENKQAAQRAVLLPNSIPVRFSEGDRVGTCC